MGTVYLQDSTLSAIGNAIRSKTGESGLLLPSQMPSAIQGITTGGGGGGEGIDAKSILENPKILEGLNYGGLLDDLLPDDKFIVTVKPKSGNSMSNIFYASTPADELDLTIDCTNFNGGSSRLSNFLYQSNVKKLNLHFINKPTNNYYMQEIATFCCQCKELEEVNDDIFDVVDLFYQRPSNLATSLFASCYNLKKLPNVEKLMINSTSTSASWAFQYLLKVKEMELPITMTTNPQKFVVRNNSFQYLYSLERLKFTNPDDIVYTNVASTTTSYTTVDLTSYVGYCATTSTYLNGMHGVQDGTLPRVTDDATYQQYKNGDYYTTDLHYSHYNKVSALETIASLPDLSGLTNASAKPTIKFKGESGMYTDGGAINTMTDEEIAVATAKNWTVTFS